MRLPSRSLIVQVEPPGAANRKRVPPKPSASTSWAAAPESSSMSRPVKPRSSVRSPT